MHPVLTVAVEHWPTRGAFIIARGSRTEAVVVVATLSAGGIAGRGECVPYARYGETVESVLAAVEGARSAVESGATRLDLLTLLPAGAARNGLDCALLDFEAKSSSRPAHVLLGLPAPVAALTCFTLSLGTADAMREAAEAAAGRPLLKVKLGGIGDPDRIRAVRRGAPNARLVVDANESWTADLFPAAMTAAADAGVLLVEQPLPAGADDALRHLDRPVPVAADESAHMADDLAGLVGLYDAVNIKLDKAGGLTAAAAMAAEARRLGLGVMVGCMVGTSLAMAPAMLLAGGADFVDLDGPLLLARDRDPGLRYDGSVVYPADTALWG